MARRDLGLENAWRLARHRLTQKKVITLFVCWAIGLLICWQLDYWPGQLLVIAFLTSPIIALIQYWIEDADKRNEAEQTISLAFKTASEQSRRLEEAGISDAIPRGYIEHFRALVEGCNRGDKIRILTSYFLDLHQVIDSLQAAVSERGADLEVVLAHPRDTPARLRGLDIGMSPSELPSKVVANVATLRTAFADNKDGKVAVKLSRRLPSLSVLSCGSVTLLGFFWFRKHAAQGTFLEVRTDGRFGREIVKHFDQIAALATNAFDEEFPSSIVIQPCDGYDHLYYASRAGDGRRTWRYVNIGSKADSDGVAMAEFRPPDEARYSWKKEAHEGVVTVHMCGIGTHFDYGMFVFSRGAGDTFAECLAGVQAHRGFNAEFELSGALLCKKPLNGVAGGHEHGELLEAEDAELVNQRWSNCEEVLRGIGATT